MRTPRSKQGATAHRGRSTIGVMATMLCAACVAGGMEPGRTPGERIAVIVAPGPVSAAIVELEGVGDVSLDKGYVFTEPTARGIRAVLLLHQPGEIRFTVTVQEGDVPPRATIVEVADETGDIPTSLEAYRVAFGG